MITRVIVFLVLNFGALALGSYFTGKGVPSEWYLSLNKAPWSPPGWVFGAAWTTIMICFSFYMAYLWPQVDNKAFLVGLYMVQLVLNISWNPAFFYYQNILAGLLIIVGLTVIVGYFLIYFWPSLKLKSVLIFPYFIWLLIATSLNLYIFLKN